jgi:hypothetical protein
LRDPVLYLSDLVRSPSQREANLIFSINALLLESVMDTFFQALLVMIVVEGQRTPSRASIAKGRSEGVGGKL